MKVLQFTSAPAAILCAQAYNAQMGPRPDTGTEFWMDPNDPLVIDASGKFVVPIPPWSSDVGVDFVPVAPTI